MRSSVELRLALATIAVALAILVTGAIADHIYFNQELDGRMGMGDEWSAKGANVIGSPISAAILDEIIPHHDFNQTYNNM
ncbi:MAG: hypothetical protein JW941_02995 [Candidatus Coatesbacteria bacterium]|nr:hypothetical protein [Candidatus Coatesbacteria bacterium]